MTGTKRPAKMAGKRPVRVFISHDSRDARLAEAFARLLKSVSAGMIEPFYSSDRSPAGGIDFGTEWYEALMSKLDAASDVLCLLTENSYQKPWILFEAGVAKGNRKALVHSLLLGGPGTIDGPFCQFQSCAFDEPSLRKLVLQLCTRVKGLEPDEQVLTEQIRTFKHFIDGAIATKVKASGNTTWLRKIPLKTGLEGNLQRINEELDALRRAVKEFCDEKGKTIELDNLRSNLMLPDFQFQDKSQFPGQLYFLATRPEKSYSKQELSNRFAPGEGVSGKVFLEGLAFAEDGRVGVAQRKLKLMHKQLTAVASFPLYDQDVRNAFGVACVDFIGADDVNKQDLEQLGQYEPVRDAVLKIASLVSPQHNASFELEFSARL